MRRELLDVVRVEEVGPYRLLRLKRGRLESGIPGQFFMLSPPGRMLPRPISLCLAPPGELAVLVDPVGPGTRALCEVDPGDELAQRRRRRRLGSRRPDGGHRCSRHDKRGEFTNTGF